MAHELFRKLTARIKSTTQFLGVKLVDHVIVGEGTYRFFADQGGL